MSDINADQRDFWTDEAGPAWIAQMDAMDRALAPVLDGVLSRAALTPGERVVDIGCGAGTSTLAAGDAVGTFGKVLGVDISETLLGVAEELAQKRSNIKLTLADAQTHAFVPGACDCLLSRFGVMFFQDTPAAFANMAKALCPGGRMVFATWAAIPDNPFFTLPAAVAKRVIGPVPKSDPDAPGPFALRDAVWVKDVLTRAGLERIVAEEVALELTPQGDARAIASLMCDIGPAERAISQYTPDAAQREELVAQLIEALGPLQTPEGIRIPALINFFTARKAA
jgi:SAM-dependent methyltransferase